MGAWRFLGVPKEVAEKIKAGEKGKVRRGWGAMKVKAKIGKTEWSTSIFPDSRSGTYLLPLKKEIRKREGILDGDEVSISLQISQH
jgi:hypothetical protein